MGILHALNEPHGLSLRKQEECSGKMEDLILVLRPCGDLAELLKMEDLRLVLRPSGDLAGLFCRYMPNQISKQDGSRQLAAEQ